MTAIARISRLRGCGIFHDFTWSADLPDFGHYNLVYGWNWSGKTTLSRLFRALEMRRAPTNGQVTLLINGRDVGGDDFAQVMLPVRVFNRDFMAESVFPFGGGDVPAIFVVGKESVEKQKAVDGLKADLTEAHSRLESARLMKEETDRTLDRFCIDRARLVKDTLRSPGENPYNNYDKSDFRTSAGRMANDADMETHMLSECDRDRLLTQHKATPKAKVSELIYRLPQLDALANAASNLLSATVTSRVIESLKDDPILSAWVHQGLRLHCERGGRKCLFCDHTMPLDRLAALKAHFSAEYEQFLKGLDAEISEMQELSKVAASLMLPKGAELHDDLAAECEVAGSALREAIEVTRQFVDLLAGALISKKGRAFERLALDVAEPEVDRLAVERLNDLIQRHNQACDDFQSRISGARQRLEADYVASGSAEFVRLSGAVQVAATAFEQATVDVGRLNGEIARLEREIVEHRRPAEELNQDLHKYLGHDELCLEIRDTGYTITRSGVPAQALSEGESTAIALLYFLKSLQDRRFDLANGVVVLDDPVSSLDANALYFAFGFIRERTQHAGQLFILTHNFTFFRQVRNWFHYLKGQQKTDMSMRPARFYMIDCVRDQNRRCSSIKWLHPLLEHYDSEYHYLFACIYRAASASRQVDLEQNYVLPNMGRRLLEAFLAFRQPQVPGELWQKLKAVQFDEAKKVRILRFLHTHSHSGAIGEPEHDPSLLSEAQAVLKDLLDMIQSQDPGHFLAMKKLTEMPTDEGGVE